MTQGHAFLGLLVAMFALLVVLGFSAYLATLEIRTNSHPHRRGRTRQP